MYKSMFNDYDGYIATIQFALNYVKEYAINGGDFDPFKVLTGTDDNHSKLNRESLNFINELENLVIDYRKTRKKLM